MLVGWNDLKIPPLKINHKGILYYLKQYVIWHLGTGGNGEIDGVDSQLSWRRHFVEDGFLVGMISFSWRIPPILLTGQKTWGLDC